MFVTNHVDLWRKVIRSYSIVTPTDYLMSDNFMTGKYRVINLCKDYSYQSYGYYVSLLAQARKHKIMPSILTIQDSKISAMITHLNDVMSNEIHSCLRAIKSDEFVLSVYFGQNIAAKYSRLARHLYNEFPHPMFRVYFIKKKVWQIQKIQIASIADVPESHHDFLHNAAKDFCEKHHLTRPTNHKKYHYDIAILYNPDEKHPPSNKRALNAFIKAGDQLGLNVNLITKDDYKFISEFDGLFIRETTAVNHHTYRISRKASSEKLLVVDDPESILKCANKVYMAEFMRKLHISTPQTTILSKSTYRDFIDKTTFPCIIKLPDSAFSIGVKKVSDKSEFLDVTSEFFKYSDLLIAQEYMPSDYDWRLGIIDNRVFYACRYYMAKNHWQIYNWDGRKTENGKKEKNAIEGDFDTVPVDEVPQQLKNIALKATKEIGNGLYGVDIKVVNNKPYIIEINDNPNIDAGVEDQVLGHEIYMTIMNYFLKQLNKMRGNE